MKTLPLAIISLCVLATLASCEYDVATETSVHPDGSLDKSILLEFDSAKSINSNLFLLGDWHSERITKEFDKELDSAREIKMFTLFTRKFESAELANSILAHPGDTLFRISSKFEKKFRWFYTHILYAETFHAINRLNYPVEDYLTPEDFAFIDRLPSEGSTISRGDSLYLNELNKKIFDMYGEHAVNDELIRLAHIIVNTSTGIDSLMKHRKEIRDALDKDSNDDLGERFIIVIDSFKIATNKSKHTEFKKALTAYSKKVSFMGTAESGKFVNRINLPWTIFNSNADSVSGNSLFWAPPTIKFLLKDYTMYGECRKLNWWAVIVSVLIVGFTGYLLVRKRD